MKNLKVNKEKIVSLLLAGSIALSMGGCAKHNGNDKTNDEISFETIQYEEELTESAEEITASNELNKISSGNYETILECKDMFLCSRANIYNSTGMCIGTKEVNTKCNAVATNGEYTLVTFDDGTDGFVSVNDLLTIDKQVNGYAYLKNSSAAYNDKEFGENIFTVSGDSILYVIFADEDYACISSADGQQIFYMRSSDLDKNFIVVDLDAQSIDCYLDYQIAGSWGTRSGKDSTPTHAGAFDIDWKAKDWEFTTYRGSYANYWIPINEYGEGIHDLIGDDEINYGNEAYHTYGSHGCIRVPVAASEFVYENYEVGDMVLVRKK